MEFTHQTQFLHTCVVTDFNFNTNLFGFGRQIRRNDTLHGSGSEEDDYSRYQRQSTLMFCFQHQMIKLPFLRWLWFTQPNSRGEEPLYICCTLHIWNISSWACMKSHCVLVCTCAQSFSARLFPCSSIRSHLNRRDHNRKLRWAPAYIHLKTKAFYKWSEKAFILKIHTGSLKVDKRKSSQSKATWFLCDVFLICCKLFFTR